MRWFLPSFEAGAEKDPERDRFFVLGWYLDSIRLLKRFKNDSGRVKIWWNFTKIPGVGDLKNTGNEEKCKKN